MSTGTSIRRGGIACAVAAALLLLLAVIPAAATVEEGCLIIIKFEDLNRNGLWTYGEPEITGWPVSWTGPINGSGTTRVQMSVPVGDYTITEGSVPGWVPTTATTKYATVCAGQTTVVKFGNVRERLVCCPRTMGYWKNHPEAITSAMYDVLKTLPAFSGVDTFAEVYAIFYRANASDMRCMLRAQLLAMTLNVLSGNVSEACCVRLYCVRGAACLFGASVLPIGDVLDIIQDEFPWSGWTRYEQEIAKNVLDYANNGWLFVPCPSDG